MKNKKKSVLVLMIVALLSMTIMVGCGGGDKDGSGSDDKGYLSWSGAEWNAASDSDKIEALKTVMVEIQSELKGKEETLDATTEAMIPAIDEMFKQSPDTKLKDIVEQAKDAMEQVPEPDTAN